MKGPSVLEACLDTPPGPSEISEKNWSTKAKPISKKKC